MSEETKTENTQGNGDLAVVSGSLPSVWTCEHGKKCKWPVVHGFPRWGRPEHSTYGWRKYHEKECGGSLIILFEGNDR